MVNPSTPSLDQIFAALSDSTRRAIVERLAQREMTVTEIAQPFPMSLPAISKHLRILETAGLIVRRKAGREHYLRLAATPMKDAAEWLDVYRQFWESQLDSLADYLEQHKDDAGESAAN
jgi:DNA-binding transcriptional ArsR family regulator